MLESVCYLSPIGSLRIFANAHGLKKIEFADSKSHSNDNANPVLKEAVKQLDEYFQAKRTDFELPLDPEGTLFQKSVWDKLRLIPFGATCSYQQIANTIEKPKAARAVGQANNRNPLPIVIPCHRVIGSNDSLVGYAGGLTTKKWLLEHEKKKM